MKKLILLSFILIATVTFSQTERTKILSTNSFNFTSILEERNHSLNNKMIINDFEEVVKVDFSLSTNNSEGKFTVYNTSQHQFLNTLNKTNPESIFATSAKEDKNKKPQSFVAENYHEFINSIVIKMKLDDTTLFNNSFYKENKNDKNIKSTLKNNTPYSIAKLDTDSIEVILGGLNLNINKVYTSELEHTIRHSLNLLVLNF
jgi:hypothetical protein